MIAFVPFFCVYCKTSQNTEKKKKKKSSLRVFVLWSVLLTVHYPTYCCLCYTYKVTGIKYWFELQLFDMIIQKVCCEGACLCMCLFFQCSNILSLSVLCGHHHDAHCTKLTSLPDWWITVASRRFTCSYINTHARIMQAHTNNYRSCFIYFVNMLFHVQKHWVSYSASFFTQKRAVFQMSSRLIHFLCRRNYNNNEYNFYCSCDKLWCCYTLI